MTNLFTPARKQAAGWLMMIVLCGAILCGCTSPPESKVAPDQVKKTKLQEELSWTIETLQPSYFEGQEIWVKVTPHVTHNVDSVLSAATQARYAHISGTSFSGAFWGSEEGVDVTHLLRNRSDNPKPRFFDVSKSELFRLPGYDHFLTDGHYKIWLEAGVRSDTLEFDIHPTPDSLFDVRFVLLADVGIEFPTRPIYEYWNVSPSLSNVWRKYTYRLLSLPQGYPYRAEGLHLAAVEYLKCNDKLKSSDSLLVKKAIVEYAKERPQSIRDVAAIVKTIWLKESDSKNKSSEYNWFIEKIADTAFTRALLDETPPWEQTPPWKHRYQ